MRLGSESGRTRRGCPWSSAGSRSRVLERLLDLEPGLIAVLLTGSYAKGTASLTSDLDLVALTASIPRTDYRMWFEERRNGPPLHVSAGATTPSGWLARRDSPARCSFGFPAINEANYLWGATQAAALLGESPSLMHPPARPELEDFIDFVLTAKTCAKAGDDLRSFAQAAASLAPSLLISSNAERIVSDRRDALDAALSLPIAPANYQRRDYLPRISAGLRHRCEDGYRKSRARVARLSTSTRSRHRPAARHRPLPSRRNARTTSRPRRITLFTAL